MSCKKIMLYSHPGSCHMLLNNKVSVLDSGLRQLRFVWAFFKLANRNTSLYFKSELNMHAWF